VFYFHFAHSTPSLDCTGVDLPNMSAARSEAVAMIADVLLDGRPDFLWTGKPLRLWVTDQPNGAGKVLFALNVTATGADQEQECLATSSATRGGDPVAAEDGPAGSGRRRKMPLLSVGQSLSSTYRLPRPLGAGD
jgi:hypothetical protein